MVDNSMQGADSERTDDESGERPLRRDVLQAAGTAAIGAVGLTGATGNAAALSCGDYTDAWTGYPHLYYGTLDGVRSGLTYRLRNSDYPDKVLDVEASSTDDGGNVHIWEWVGGDNQKWQIDWVGDGWRLTAQHSGKVLDVEGASTDDGANVHQWEWLDNDNQTFDIYLTDGTGDLKLEAQHSGKVVDADNYEGDNGTEVMQWDWWGGENQQWSPELVDNDGTLFIFTHGWLEEIGGSAEDQAYTAELSLRDEGVDAPVIGNEYDSLDLDWWDAKDEARDAGDQFGDWLADFIDRNPDVTVRVMGHSLGAMMTLTALNRLAEYGKSITTLDLVGGAVDHGSIGGEWADGIRNAAEAVHNYHSYEDGVLDVIYEVGEWDDAVGYSGAEGSTPGNYTDHDVTDEVGSHCEYFKSDGCMHRVVANW